MGKTKFCRICRTESNLKYTTKELRQLNKKQLLLAQATQQGQSKNRVSKKLLLTTPTLGNICHVCDERIQIFHRLDDGGHQSNSDVEIDVNESNPVGFADTFQNGDIHQRTPRPETPVIVDDDDMLFNIFVQKFDQKTQLQRHETNSSFSQQQLEKQFVNQFLTTYTPPQSTGGSSEGDESKAIEVLTSRENTPAPVQSMPHFNSNSNKIDAQGHRIVAIIELDDVDENEPKNCGEGQSVLSTPLSSSSDLSSTENILHKPVLLSPSLISSFKSPAIQDTRQTVDVEDDEEIVFRTVDTDQANTPVLKKKKRKSYDEKQLRLVASLSLVSSDSETEEHPSKDQPMKVPNAVGAKTSTLIEKKHFKCSVCELVFPDLEGLSVHEHIHQGVKCILCQIGFQQIKRLIHHMRHKHREYNGDALLEKPRSAQDSCMTIRLRYMQHTTFYECQLCGRIDDVFREHKEHIIDKHPNESKSLKDPMMKQLKCPVCKAKCGAQYLSLCRHLVNSHEPQEYQNHLRELVHVSAFGWNVARQQEVAQTAKIFQFIKRKTFFFECKICRKVVAGYLHHLRHVNEHKKSANIETNVKTTASKQILPIKASSTATSLNTSNLDKLCKILKKDGACISMKLRKKDNLSRKLTNHTSLNNKKTKTENVIEMSKTVGKPKENSTHSATFKNNYTEQIKKTNKTLKTKKSKAEVKIDLKKKSKPKEKEKEKLPKSTQLTKGKSMNGTCKKYKKTKHNELKPQVVKVKVKAPVRQIDLQKYKCKFCLKNINGFHLYNLHLLRQHRKDEYTTCNKCNKLYTARFFNLDEHITQCVQVHSISKRKRKFSKQPSLSENLTESSEPCANKVPNKNAVDAVYFDNEFLWLKDLLKLKEPPEKSESPNTALFIEKPTKSQCCYCLHLFANDNDLKDHKNHHHSQNPDILIKYKPFKNPKINE